MEFEIISIFDYLNVFIASFFFVYYVVSMSDKTNISDKRINYLISSILSLLGMLVCHLVASSEYSRFSVRFSIVVFALTVIVLTFIINGDGLRRKLKIISLFIFPIAIISVVINFYFEFVLGKSIAEFGNRTILILFSTFVLAMIIVYSVSYVLFRSRKEMAGYLNAIIVMLLFSVQAFLDLAFVLNAAPDKIGNSNIVGSSLQLITASAIAVSLLNILRKSRDVVVKEREQRNLESMRDMNKQYYDSVQNDIEHASKLRHDLANYIEQIEYLINHPEKDSDDVLRSMVNELKIKADSIVSRNYCDDQIINTIMTLKDEKCRKLGIPFKVKVNLPFSPDVDPLDGSSLLSNLIDNAIKSALECQKAGKEGSVSVTAGILGDHFVVRTENDTLYDGEIDDIKAFIESVNRKRVKDGHGYGLKIVQEIVAKYGGSLIVKIKDRKCVIVAAVKCNAKGELTNV